MFKNYFLSKNKNLEIQIESSDKMFSFNFFRRKGDHAGFCIEISLFKKDIYITYYDSRHWNDDRNRFYLLGEEALYYTIIDKDIKNLGFKKTEILWKNSVFLKTGNYIHYLFPILPEKGVYEVDYMTWSIETYINGGFHNKKNNIMNIYDIEEYINLYHKNLVIDEKEKIKEKN